jgi:hypothetical protein
VGKMDLKFDCINAGFGQRVDKRMKNPKAPIMCLSDLGNHKSAFSLADVRAFQGSFLFK